MSQDLLSQLAEYGAYCDERQGTVDATDVIGPVVPIPAPVLASRPIRGWLVAAAAAALILLLFGGLALLAPFRGGAPVVDQPIATTIPIEIITTTVPTEAEPAEASEATETTLASTPVLPPGEGPKLEFAQVELPDAPGAWFNIRPGAWFKGALYASNWDGIGERPYRSVDGFNWEIVPNFSPSDTWGSTKTDGERLVNVAGPDSQGYCLGAGASIQINTSRDGVEWMSSEIPLPLPSTTGCFTSNGTDIAVGPQGIMVTTSVGLEIGGGSMQGLPDPEEGVHLEVAEVDVERRVVTVRLTEVETGEVVDTIEIDGLSKSLGDLLDAMAADAMWEPLIGPLLRNAAGDGPGLSRGFAWFSTDGMSWRPIGDVGPLQGANTPSIASIVATADGFVATSEATGGRQSGPVQEVLWYSVGGTTWTEGAGLAESHLTSLSRPDERGLYPGALDVWAGRPVAVTDEGVWTIEDSPLQLIPAEAVAGLYSNWIGDFGFIAVASEMEGGGTEVLFSADGSTWNRWSPSEFGTNGTLYPMAMADDFVLLRLIQESGSTFWIGRLP